MNTKGKDKERTISIRRARIVGTAYLQGIDHASIPWPMVSAKGGGKIAGNTVRILLAFTTGTKRKGEKGNYIVYVGEKDI